MSDELDINELKRAFLEYVEINKGRAVKTVENYDRYLSKFISSCRINNISDISLDTVNNFRIMLNRDGLSKKTQNYYMIAIRMFLKYIRKFKDIDVLHPDLIELAKQGGNMIEFLTEDELNALFNAVDMSNLAGLRDRAILETLFATGLRVSELVALNRDISLKTNRFTVTGKGGKNRLVFITDEAKEFIETYLDKRMDFCEAMFVNHPKNIELTSRLTPRSVQRIVLKYSKKAGINKHITPHTLRHTFATRMLERGVDIRYVKEFLGHSSISTTQVYTHATDNRLEDIYNRFYSKK